ncbi:MAG: metallophosphoesterase family protein [Hyphomicrobiaceae bacterium]|nr:metallophosphoesterase family protein [Hyphomicrobiaceae bacterium]
MRVALLADIHANLEALRACLADARAQGAERSVYLGDIVGYGADPAACVEIVREACGKGAIAIKGNHDEAVNGTRFRLNDAALAAVEWTRAVLAPEDLAFLDRLPMSATQGSCLFVHASAKRPEAWPYILGLDEAIDSLNASEAHLTVCGHIHTPALYNLAATGKVMVHTPVAGTAVPLLSQRRWLAVMGAVGQPRDGNPAAAYGIWDTQANTISYLRVPYDIETAAAKIRRAGLPDVLWRRLSAGR